ncbi:hypothetical protein PR202_ga00130 [Eleusine coracana subsp. coracana]|uniref:Cystathionine gamma-lyase n=1 Tax=Eleusine coracana subsp. coracana TaxID=191504 RepID=A0AAV5BFI4_ELECO|nr:hypothetical protein PR202_ga00130 [Eleusine coracana subsp. coracana]
MAPPTALVMTSSLPRQQRRFLQPLHSPKHRRITASFPAELLQDFFGGADDTAHQPLEHSKKKPQEPEGSPTPVASQVSDETLVVHAGEKMGNGTSSTDSIATPVVSGTSHWFKNSEDLIAFKEGRRQRVRSLRKPNGEGPGGQDQLAGASRGDTGDVVRHECYRGNAPRPHPAWWPYHVLAKNDVTLFYADSPTNPMLKCLDISLVAELCHQKGALVCIDSTLAPPINQKPLTLGADVVLHSATKYMAGHHDVIAGCVSGSEALISKVRAWHHDIGGAISPNAAYMIIRGLKTMALRVEAQNRTALLMAFEVKSDLRGTMRFIDALDIPFIATSLGGCESLVQQPGVMSFWGQSGEEKAKNGIKDNLVRFSFGIERFEDLRDDILQALDKI